MLCINNNRKKDDLDIVDVTNLTPKIIFKPEKKVQSKKSAWDKGFKLPLSNRFDSKTQVYDEAYKMYNVLCDTLDKYLIKEGTSLSSEVRRIHYDGGFYNDILKTIQYIAEGHVSKVYRGSSNYYGLEYSYKLLEKHFDSEVRKIVFNQAQRLESSVAAANSETIRRFNLLDNGFAFRWWDKKGIIRSHKSFTREENNFLDATPARETVVWFYPTMNEEMILLYIKLFNLIHNSIENEEWDLSTKVKLKKIVQGNTMYYEDYNNGKFLSSLLKLTESTIRAQMDFLQNITVNQEYVILESLIPETVMNMIKNELHNYGRHFDHKRSIKILDEVINYDSSNLLRKMDRFKLSENHEYLPLLVSYESEKDFDRLLKRIIVANIDDDLTLAALFALDRDEQLSKKNQSTLEKLLHPSQLKSYEKLIDSTDKLSLKILNDVMSLRKPKVRRVKLSADKLKKSQEKLDNTVDIIEQFIGVDISDEEVEIEEIVEKEVIIKYKKFNDLIYTLTKNAVSINDVEKISSQEGKLVSMFIDDLNQSLYEYVEDQVIVIEDDMVMIDDFYLDIVKELVEDEKEN